MRPINHFINGEWIRSQDKKTLQGVNPSTGAPLYELARGASQDVALAVTSAELAFPAWSNLPPIQRADVLDRIASEIERRKSEFVEAESEDQGKPRWLADQLDIARAIANFRFFASRLRQWEHPSTAVDSQTFNYVLRKPRGVVGLISPWNLPLYLLSWKLAPAIAVGNTAICKPSELTSLTAHLLSEVLVSAGLPPGVCNIVYGLGSEAGQALVEHPKVSTISFTGGTATGQRIAEVAAMHMKKLSLELGGKNPTLVFRDAPREGLYKQIARSAFLNQGEICLCGSRIYVEDSFFTEFTEGFLNELKSLKVGDPASSDSFMGPLVSKEHLAKVASYVDVAKAEGGTIHQAPFSSSDLPASMRNGFWFPPTVLTGLAETSRCIQEEIFGPVVSLSRFSDFEDGIAKANNVKYGLSASVWTESLKTAHAAASRIHAGTVWVNTWLNRDLRMPFGGTKASGVGREGGDYSFEFFSEATTVCVRYP